MGWPVGPKVFESGFLQRCSKTTCELKQVVDGYFQPSCTHLSPCKLEKSLEMGSFQCYSLGCFAGMEGGGLRVRGAWLVLRGMSLEQAESFRAHMTTYHLHKSLDMGSQPSSYRPRILWVANSSKSTKCTKRGTISNHPRTVTPMLSQDLFFEDLATGNTVVASQQHPPKVSGASNLAQHALESYQRCLFLI